MPKLNSDRSTYSSVFACVKNYLSRESGRYCLLAIIRFLLVFLPQTGYVHKDEFFESLEDAAGDALGVDSARGWRMGSDGTPNRHVSFPLLIIGGPLFTLRCLSNFAHFLFGFSSGVVTPYTVLVAARLCACALSFITDYYMVRLFAIIGPKTSKTSDQFARRLVLLAGSGAMLIYGTRTLTSVFEMSLYTALIYYVASSITPPRQRALGYHAEKSKKTFCWLPSDFATALPVAALTVFGCYNRPGFALFVAFPLLAWMLRSHSASGTAEQKATSAALALAKRASLLAFGAAPALIILSALDAIYYGPPPENGGLRDTVALVNEPPADLGDPRPPWSVVLNTISTFNVIGVVAIFRALCAGVSLLMRRPYFVGRRLEAFLSWCSAGPLLIMTFLAPFGMGDKEPYFLLPLLPLFILLNGDLFMFQEKSDGSEQRVQEHGKLHFEITPCKQQMQLSKLLIRVWLFCNVLFTIYHGFLKDAGTYGLVTRIHNEISLGVALLGLPKEPRDPGEMTSQYGGTGGQRRVRYGRRVYMNELGDSTVQELHRRVAAILDMCRLRYGLHERRCTVLAAIPGTLSDEYENLVARRRKRDGVKLVKDSEIFPHVSWQAPANWQDITRPGATKRFSLMLYTAHRTNG